MISFFFFLTAMKERTLHKRVVKKMVIVSKYMVPIAKKYKPFLSNNEVIKVKFQS